MTSSTDTLYQGSEFNETYKEWNKEENIINEGEDDEMEVYGYERSVLKTAVTWILITATLGSLRLIFHWSPHWMLYATHRKCFLEKADTVLVVDRNRGQSTSYMVKKVRKIVLNTLSLGDVQNVYKELDVSSLEHLASSRRSITIYLHDGSSMECDEIVTVKIKKLLYVWVDEKKRFTKITGLDRCLKKVDFHSIRGYSSAEQALRRRVYGENEININMQSITQLIGAEILTPFYMFEIFTLLVWFAEEYLYYSYAIIAMSAFGVGSAVIQTRNNQKKLYETVYSTGKVMVCRDMGKTKNDARHDEIFTNYLVPGDVIVVPRQGFQMPCDAVLLCGNCIVNESMLTGESVPVTKTPLPCHHLKLNLKEDTNHILFCGTQVLQARYYADEYVYAVVIRTGFFTAKGSLVRSILYPLKHDFKFDQDINKFILILSGIALVGAVYSYIIKTMQGIDVLTKIIETLDIITIVVPPALPAAMTVGKMYAVKRLRSKNISCINSSVVNVAGSVNCVCFDKTGTLTEDGLDLYGVAAVTSGKLQDVIKDARSCKSHKLLSSMASCHSLTIIDGVISGDPLDVKMFEATEWTLDEPHVTDSIKYDLLAPTVVTPPPEEAQSEIGLIHQFQFSSSLQRMSVITRRIESKKFTVYCKGSPEMIRSLCLLTSVPENLEAMLHKYTERGYRVIAMAYKKMPVIDVYKLRKLRREDVEKDLTFLGLIIFENKLKPETVPIIKELRRAKTKLIMLTGDNIQTAVCVAKECGFIAPEDRVTYVNVEDRNGLSHTKVYFTSSSNNTASVRTVAEKSIFSHYVENDINAYNLKLALTGDTWRILKQIFPSLIPKIVSYGVIFSRMSPDQKQQVVEELQSLGYYVVMCGDGANDCGALRTAHVGISLSESESSAASPFTSHTPNISCVPQVIREGRAALVTSFGLFKFMVLYSLLEFFSTALLYSIRSNLSDFEFLYIDICLIVVFGFFFGQSEPYKGTLVSTPPPSSLISIIPVFSLILQTCLMFGIQVCTFITVRQFSWYERLYFGKNEFKNYENYAVFTVSQFQYIVLAVCFSLGKPYREPFYKNTYFFLSIIIMTLISSFITLYPSSLVQSIFQFKFPPFYDFPCVVLSIAVLTFIVSYTVENIFLNRVLSKLVSQSQFNAECSVKKNSHTSNKFNLSAEHLSETDVKSYGTITYNI